MTREDQIRASACAAFGEVVLRLLQKRYSPWPSDPSFLLDVMLSRAAEFGLADDDDPDNVTIHSTTDGA